MNVEADRQPLLRTTHVSARSGGASRAFDADPAPGLDMGRALEAVRRRIAMVLGVLVVGAALAFAAGSLIRPTYTASALLAVNQIGDSPPNCTSCDPIEAQIAILESPAFLSRAYAALTPEQRRAAAIGGPIEFGRRLAFRQQRKSRLVSVEFTATSPAVAAEVANSVAILYVEDPFLQSAGSVDDLNRGLARRIQAIETALAALNGASPDGADAAELRRRLTDLKMQETLARGIADSRAKALTLSPPVQLVAAAEPPAKPRTLKPLLMVIPGALAAGLLGVGLALVLGKLDTRLYLPGDVQRSFSAAFAGALPPRSRRTRRRPTMAAGYLRAMDAVIAQALLTRFARPGALIVTTSAAVEESSTFAAHLGAAAARLGRRTLLIDLAPARRLDPARASSPAPTDFGIFDVLAGRCGPMDAVRRLPGAPLDWIPGPADDVPDALPFLANGRLRRVLEDLGQQYDWVILNARPVLGFSETRLIAVSADTVFLVLRSGRTRRPDAAAASETLAASMPPADDPGGAHEGTRLFAVLADAPPRSLPQPFRDRRDATGALTVAGTGGDASTAPDAIDDGPAILDTSRAQATLLRAGE